MAKYNIENAGETMAEFLSWSRWEAMPWRKIAVDAGLLALFLITSSWFMKG